MFVFVLVSFLVSIIVKRKREQVVLLLLSYGCLVTVNVLWLFLTVPWVGLQCAIVVFPDHTHLPFDQNQPFWQTPSPLKRQWIKSS